MSRQSLNGARFHVIVPAPTRRALAVLSRETGMTAAEHIRRALDLYLVQAKAQRKPADAVE